MLCMEEWLMLKNLQMEGMSISAIARETEHDRKTVQKYLASGMQMSHIKKRRRIPVGLCESFSDNIIGHIRNGLSAKEIYRDLVTNHDFLGSYESIKLYVRKQYQNLQLESHQDEYFASLWILKLLQGGIHHSELESQFKGNLNAKDISTLVYCVLNKPLGHRNRAITILSYLKRISKRTIAKALFLDPKTVRDYIQRFEEGGVENLFDLSRKNIKKSEDQKYKDAVFSILHAPPSSYGFNRTTWRMGDIKNIMCKNGLPISKDNIRKIIKDAGYHIRKAKKVLTSVTSVM